MLWKGKECIMFINVTPCFAYHPSFPCSEHLPFCDSSVSWLCSFSELSPRTLEGFLLPPWEITTNSVPIHACKNLNNKSSLPASKHMNAKPHFFSWQKVWLYLILRQHYHYFCEITGNCEAAGASHLPAQNSPHPCLFWLCSEGNDCLGILKMTGKGEEGSTEELTWGLKGKHCEEMGAENKIRGTGSWKSWCMTHVHRHSVLNSFLQQRKRFLSFN